MGAPFATTLVRSVTIPAGGVQLPGDLTVPVSACGIVVFAHGSGSSRHSPRNRLIAARLTEARLGTLLLDLLTEDEEQQDLRTRALRFDIPRLAERTVAAIDWLGGEPATGELAVGCFGASTGAAAALVAAARRPERVGAVVSRGGRPDLAGSELQAVRAPTLLIVGAADPLVLEINRQAQRQLRHEMRLEIIPGATHLFEEPRALERVAELAHDWFLVYLCGQRRERS